MAHAFSFSNITQKLEKLMFILEGKSDPEHRDFSHYVRVGYFIYQPVHSIGICHMTDCAK